MKHMEWARAQGPLVLTYSFMPWYCRRLDWRLLDVGHGGVGGDSSSSSGSGQLLIVS